MLTFHRAQMGDIPLLRQLAAEIWHASYATMLSAEQRDYMLGLMYAEETIARELAEGVHWEIARLDGGPIGFLALSAGRGAPAKLHKLYLLPALQGRGHGQEMIARAVTIARAAQAPEIGLQVNKTNQRAQRAYQRAGFQISSAATFDIGGGFVMDDYLMTRPLSAPTPPS